MRRPSHLFLFSNPLSISFSSVAKIALIYLVLLSCLSWRAGAAAAAGSGDAAAIPQDAIRIRIIANSDSAFDQQVKRDVRDRVADMIASWGAMPSTHDEARALIASHLPDIREAAGRVLDERGVVYDAEATLSEVPFPEKIFGGRPYAAGDYEALRITLGGGEGANWWCVLFPPLCLTAATAGEPPARQSAAAGVKAGESAEAGAGRSRSVASPSARAPTSDASQASLRADAADADKPKPRFFLWEMLRKLGAFLQSLFS